MLDIKQIGFRKTKSYGLGEIGKHPQQVEKLHTEQGVENFTFNGRLVHICRPE